MKTSFCILSMFMCAHLGCAGGDVRDATGFAASNPSAPRDPGPEDSDSTADSENSGDSDGSGGPGSSGDAGSDGDSGSSGLPEETGLCGDGVLGGPAELCDDGAQNGDYGKCNENCTGLGPHCGDGAVSGPEACDDANVDDSDACTSECVTAACGDGVVQPGTEACDDGRNGDQDDGCTDACSLPACGDGFVQTSLGEACDDGDPDVEDGCEPDCSATTKTVFVTSQKLQGDFAGVLNADQFCQSAANFAGLPGIYMAWLSDGNLRPASRFVASEYPYTLVDGSVVADDLIDLVDGVLDHAINVDELGLTAPEKTYAWTGVKADGYTSSIGCDKWTATKSDMGQWPNSLYGLVGDAWQTNDDWSERTPSNCISSLSMYCFEQ